MDKETIDWFNIFLFLVVCIIAIVFARPFAEMVTRFLADL